MTVLHIAALIAALVCFIIAALPLGAPLWNRLIAAGLALFTAAAFL